MKAGAIHWQIFKTFEQYLHLDTWYLMEVTCAAWLANQLGRPATWLMVIGPPSSAKTVLVSAFSALPHTLLVNKLTNKTLVSGSIDRKNKTSLLHRISDVQVDGVHYSQNTKYFLFPDFASIFSLTPNVKNEMLATFRNVWDGEVDEHFGTGKSFSWRGHVGALGAATYSWDEEVKQFRDMGERFLLWREYPLKNVEAALDKAAEQDDDQLKEDAKEAIQLLLQLGLPSRAFDLREANEWLNWLARHVAIARTPIRRNAYSRDQEALPVAEEPMRLRKQFRQMLKGLLWLRGWTAISDEPEGFEKAVKPVLERLAFSCLPHMVVETLARIPVGGVTLEDLKGDLKLTESPVRRQLEDLRLLGIVDRVDNVGRLWVVTQEWREFVGKIRTFWEGIQPVGR